MVVQPEKVLKTATDSEANTLKQLEARIDTYLKTSFDGTRNIAYGIDENCRALRENVLEKFLNKYRSVGWKVKIVCDPRDGDYIDFSYNANKSNNGGRRI